MNDRHNYTNKPIPNKRKRKVIYNILLSELEKEQEDFIVRIERDDGKSLTSTSHHMFLDYLNDEANWLTDQ